MGISTLQGPDQRGQDGSIRPGQSWPPDLATKNGDFVTEHNSSASIADSPLASWATN
jgi:hypothetical protein